ncbi:hypothetical protein PsorP6_013352 [Peronosclerospora sorghi]|uniref:Uncharacterized protein n=1 Tax=Peronosclerospora sorghi TaxID=230839 RepID=A0ACC0WGP6_9STRA|nr:hypothetical protein PsorP6_013352 [Peronosclerospora sorghi]
MTSVVLSPPSGPANSSAAVPASNKNVLMTVAVDSGNMTSPTSTAIGQESYVEINVEPAKEQDDDSEKRSNSAPNGSPTAEEHRPKKKRRCVYFECAEIVEFEPTIYTTSVTSGGVPVGMSLNERSRSRRRLDSFEMERADKRIGRQSYMEEGYLDPQEREVILNNAGCENPIIASVEAEVNTIIQHRRESNEIDLDLMYGADIMEIHEDDILEDEDEVKVLSVLNHVHDDAGEGSWERCEEEQKSSEGGTLKYLSNIR